MNGLAQRLQRATEQFLREATSAGSDTTDCAFFVSVKDGVVSVEAKKGGKREQSTAIDDTPYLSDLLNGQLYDPEAGVGD
jgi:hypothetical protein